ncbi:ABC transporter permease [Actinomyces viscosus]|uniref:ABC-type transport system involved in multi-copper enzyme maturation, permease component n=1 Tax=Actinomyces viscosus TaxID=1656 RepID=A0A448PMI8_ACTVI|nr:ABC transporter permease [Actinomyces viscosus]TFH52438.1 ABC transporter permease [Actinomyces viscosus]VEI17140.1 ABC-type transport system involved in multi-copper enzyme maturation, permease component [Actinomyces viscosus]
MTWTGVRTIMVLELRQRVRATRWRVMLGIWLAVLILLCGGLTITVETMGPGPSRDYVVALYDLVVCFVLGIGLIVAPTLSATSINGDRADATLALLQATALRSQEIVVGKLLAAWVAAIAFLGVAAPFLIILTVAGGSHWQALVAHLVILVFTLGAVCAIGLGFSSLTARPSASAVLTYIVVAALTVGTPLATAIASSVVTGTQTEVLYEVSYDDSTDDKVVCQTEPETSTHDVTRTDRIWWMLAPNPFVALGDATAHVPLQPASRGSIYSPSPLTIIGRVIDGMRDPQPERVVHNPCEVDDSDDDSSPTPAGDAPTTRHLAFWPASLVALMALGVGGVVTASRRLRVPAGRLPRGIRLA